LTSHVLRACVFHSLEFDRWDVTVSLLCSFARTPFPHPLI
jgi:hypothetical protein